MKAAEKGPAHSRVWLPILATTFASAATAGVTFDPAIAVGVANTDNVLFVPQNPQSATIYELLPSFTLAQDGKRLKSDVAYHAEAYRYQQEHDNDVFHNVKATTQVALDPDNFFLTFGANRDQTIRDPESPIPITNLGHTSNRVDRDDFYVAPSFRYPLGGGDTVAEGSFRDDQTHYRKTTGIVVPDFGTDSLRFSLNNYRKGRGTAWAFKYNADKTSFDLFDPWEHREAGVEIGGWATNRLRLFASGGRETPWDDPRNTSLTDPYWEVGFATGAGRNLAVEIAAGERSFGPSRRASLSATFAHGQTALEYAERPTTQGYDYYRDLILGGVAQGVPLDLLNRPGAAERFISKVFNWSMSFNLRHTTLSASIYNEQREQRVTLAGAPLEDESQAYVNLSATWHPGSRLDLRVGAQDSERELGAVAYGLKTLTLGADYKLGSRTAVEATLSHTRGESRGAAPYDVDIVTLVLTRHF